MYVIILEPDRTIGACITESLARRNIDSSVVSTADEAVGLADKKRPDAVITELSLSGHSGSEFMYEFRTYYDWQDIPLIVYSSMKVDKSVRESADWKLLHINQMFYKPTDSLETLGNYVSSLGDV